ncbi:MAG: hypothetical protein P1P84_03120 [Deferrisomatales bacterium]|nr:hypothetical protein [Deferrisomatales bacterium]
MIGVEKIDHEPRIWENSRYVFLNPAFLNGVMVEVIDWPEVEAERAMP